MSKIIYGASGFRYDTKKSDFQHSPYCTGSLPCPNSRPPFFSEGITLINQNIGFMRKDSPLTSLYGSLPVFTHDIDDMPSFRMFTSQLYINGSVSQAEICRAFGVSKNSVLRSVKLYRSKGMAGFFAPRNCRGPAVLTPPVLEQVQERLDNGHPRNC